MGSDSAPVIGEKPRPSGSAVREWGPGFQQALEYRTNLRPLFQRLLQLQPPTLREGSLSSSRAAERLSWCLPITQMCQPLPTAASQLIPGQTVTGKRGASQGPWDPPELSCAMWLVCFSPAASMRGLWLPDNSPTCFFQHSSLSRRILFNALIITCPFPVRREHQLPSFNVTPLALGTGPGTKWPLTDV